MTTATEVPPDTAIPTPGRVAMYRLLVDFHRDPLRMYCRARNRYGDVMLLRDLRGRPWVFVAHPDDIERIHQSNHRNYGRGRLNEPFTMFLGAGLLTSEPEVWRGHRQVMTPYFRQDHKQRFVEAVHDHVTRVLDGWEPRAAAGEAFDVTEELAQLTFRIVMDGMFGFDWGPEEREILRELDAALHYVSRATFRMISPPAWMPSPAGRRFGRSIRTLDRAVLQAIAVRRADGDGRADLLDALIGADLPDDAIRDEVLTMLHAGQHTVASGLSFALHLLSAHPVVEAELRDEIARLDGRPPALSDLPDLPYLRMVLHETLRLFPPAWGGVREPLGDDVLGGCAIRTGTPVVFSQFVTQRHPDFWPEPYRFDPTRFTEGRVRERPKYAYFPFGGGPHLCIGHELAMAEMSIVLVMLLTRYRLRAAVGHEVTPVALLDLVPRHGVVMRADLVPQPDHDIRS
jgi:cytochrome P450